LTPFGGILVQSGSRFLPIERIFEPIRQCLNGKNFLLIGIIFLLIDENILQFTLFDLQIFKKFRSLLQNLSAAQKENNLAIGFQIAERDQGNWYLPASN